MRRMSPPELSPGSPPPPGPPEPVVPSRRPLPSAPGTLGIITAPGLACLLIGLAIGSGGNDSAFILVLVVSGVGSVFAGAFAGRRMALRLSEGQEPSGLATAGCCFLCFLVAVVLSFGGCLVGALSSANFR